jgi:hypothetical protein
VKKAALQQLQQDLPEVYSKQGEHLRPLACNLAHKLVRPAFNKQYATRCLSPVWFIAACCVLPPVCVVNCLRQSAYYP